MAQDGPEMVQGGPRWSPDGAQMGPDGLKMGQDSAKMGPRRAKMAPESAPDRLSWAIRSHSEKPLKTGPPNPLFFGSKMVPKVVQKLIKNGSVLGLSF